jgi:hypothetical protein
MKIDKDISSSKNFKKRKQINIEFRRKFFLKGEILTYKREG